MGVLDYLTASMRDLINALGIGKAFDALKHIINPFPKILGALFWLTDWLYWLIDFAFINFILFMTVIEAFICIRANMQREQPFASALLLYNYRIIEVFMKSLYAVATLLVRVVITLVSALISAGAKLALALKLFGV